MIVNVLKSLHSPLSQRHGGMTKMTSGQLSWWLRLLCIQAPTRHRRLCGHIYSSWDFLSANSHSYLHHAVFSLPTWSPRAPSSILYYHIYFPVSQTCIHCQPLSSFVTKPADRAGRCELCFRPSRIANPWPRGPKHPRGGRPVSSGPCQVHCGRKRVRRQRRAHAADFRTSRVSAYFALQAVGHSRLTLVHGRL